MSDSLERAAPPHLLDITIQRLIGNLLSIVRLPLSPPRISERLEWSGSSERLDSDVRSLKEDSLLLEKSEGMKVVDGCVFLLSSIMHATTSAEGFRTFRSSCSSADRSSSARNCSFDVSASCHHQEPATSQSPGARQLSL